MTPDFRLISDAPADEQLSLLSLLTRLGPVAGPFLPGKPTSQPTALKIVVFSRRGDFRELTGKRKFAGFMQPSLQTNRLLIGPIRGDLTETALHEYAHYLLRNRLDVSLPLWFDEGLASLLGQTTFDDDTARIGALPAMRLDPGLHNDRPPPAAALAQTLDATSVEDWPPQWVDAFYDWSLLVVHYLYFDKLAGAPIAGTDLERYLAERNASLPEHLGLSRRALVQALERHLKRSGGAVSRPSPAPEIGAADFRCLDDYERDLELARAILEQNPDRAEALLAPYRATQQQNVGYLVTRARTALAADDPETATRLVDHALRLEPTSAEASVFKADTLIWSCLFDLGEDCRERWQAARELYRRGVRSNPNRFDGVVGLGLAYLYTGRPGEAVNYMKVAYARAPWAAMVNYYLGESYRLIGDTRARPYLTNARNWAVLPVWRKLAEESLRRLDEGTEASDGV